jgi:glutathione S-transferase
MEKHDTSLTLYHCPQSRSIVARWMLGELGIPYRTRLVDVHTGSGRTPEFLAINPMGKVPTLVDGDAVITESAAICLYLAERFAPGELAPSIDDPQRGPFLRWLFFAPIFDVSMVEHMLKRMPPPRQSSSWGDRASVLDTMRVALGSGPWLLGERFTAADVALGGGVAWGRAMGLVPDDEPFRAYATRIMARPAFEQAWNEPMPAR